MPAAVETNSAGKAGRAQTFLAIVRARPKHMENDRVCYTTPLSQTVIENNRDDKPSTAGLQDLPFSPLIWWRGGFGMALRESFAGCLR